MATGQTGNLSYLSAPSELLNLSNALSVATQLSLMSRESASFVWKKYLREHGYLPPKEISKVTPKGE